MAVKWWQAFGKREEEVPEALRNLSPDEIVAKLGEAASATQKAAELEQSLTTEKATRAGLQTEFERVKTQVQTLETQVRSKAEPPPRNNGSDPIPSVLDDEDEAFRRRNQPLVDLTLSIGEQAARTSFVSSLTPADRRIYDKYKADIDGVMSREPAGNRVFTDRWNVALTFIKGQKMSEILDKRDEFFSEGGGTGPGANLTSPADKDKLSDEETSVAAKMGLKPDEYKARRDQVSIFEGGHGVIGGAAAGK